MGRLMTRLYWKSDARPRPPPLTNWGTGDPTRRQRWGNLFQKTKFVNEKRLRFILAIGFRDLFSCELQGTTLSASFT